MYVKPLNSLLSHERIKCGMDCLNGQIERHVSDLVLVVLYTWIRLLFRQSLENGMFLAEGQVTVGLQQYTSHY